MYVFRDASNITFVYIKIVIMLTESRVIIKKICYGTGLVCSSSDLIPSRYYPTWQDVVKILWL